MMVQLPAPFSDLPRVQLQFDRPSDVEALERLTASLNCGASIWIKRDDCNSGLAFGGNKVRKLEYVLADALRQNADTLVTTGGVQSNHMRQTAAAAARLGLKVALYPRDAVRSDHPEYKSLGNVQLAEILGAETFPIGTDEASVLDILKKRDQHPYSIPSGASTSPFGGLGYARWAFEVLEQEAQLGTTFDVIVTAVGSGSTLGGMLAGFKLAQNLGRPGSTKRLVGFSIMGKSDEAVSSLVLGIARTTAAKIGLAPEDITADDFELDGGYCGSAYGSLDQRTVDGIRELARLEGVLTDPVYTGKAFTGLLHTAKAGGFRGNVLFCHTGGQAAMSAYPQLR